MAQKFLHDITILGSDGSTATIQGAGQSTLNLKTTTNSKNNYIVGSTTGSLSFRPNGTQALILNSSQNATFAGNVTLNGDGKLLKFTPTSYDDVELGIDSNGFVIYNTTDARYDLKISGTGNATFAGKVGVGATASDFHADADDLVVGGGSGNTGITIQSGTTGYGSIFFADGTADDATEKRGQIRYLQGTERMDFHTDNVSTAALSLAASGAATFTGDVTINKGTTGDPTLNFIENSGGSQNAKIRFDQASENQLYITTSYASPTDANRILLQPGGYPALIAYGGANGITSTKVEVTNDLEVDGKATFAGVLALPDGSATAPSIGNTGDTNTGVYWPGDHQLGFAVNGSRKMYMSETKTYFQNQANGVEINNGLIVAGANTHNKIQSYYSGSYISGWKFSDYNGGIWYDAGADDLTLNAGHANSQMLLNSGGAIALTLNASQNAIFAGDVILPATKALYLDGGGGTYIYQSSDGVIDFYGDTVQLLTAKQNGTQSEVVVNEGSGDVDFRVEANTNAHAFFVEAEGKGKVGIGTGTPSAKFEVQGSVGQLFSVTDSLTGDLFSVSDISGIPIFNVNSDGTTTLDGDATFAGNISLNDGKKITLGTTDNDLEIYHSGTHSYIRDVGTGSLYLQTNGSGIYLQDTDGNAMAQFTDGGGSFLMCNGNLKLSTTNTGIAVTGELTINNNASDNNKGIHIKNDTDAYGGGITFWTEYSGTDTNVARVQGGTNGSNGILYLQTANTSKVLTTALSLDFNQDAAFTGNVDVRGGGSGYNSIRIVNNITANNNKQAGITTSNHAGNSVSIMQYATNSGANTVYYGSADGAHSGLSNHRFYVNASPNTPGSGHTQALHIASNTNATFAGNITAGSTSLAASSNYVLDVKKAYSSGNGHVAYFGAGVDTAAKTNFDTVVIAQDDVPCLAIIEGNDPNTHSSQQALRLAVGDNNAVISASNTSGGLLFFVDRATDATGFATNSGTRALHLLNNGNATFAGNIDAGAAGKLSFTGTSGSPDLIIKNNTATSSTSGTATLKFNQALNSAGGKIVSGRDSNYADGAARDSNLKFYTSTDATDTLVLTLDSNNNATFAGRIKQHGADTQTNVTASSDLGIELKNTSDTDGNFIPIDFFNSTGYVTGRIGAEFQDAGDRNTDLFFCTRANSGTLREALRINSSQNAAFAGSVTVAGNLTVDGTTTTLNTETIEVEDNILQLNTTEGTPDTATAATSGISIYRGDGVAQASLIFDDADDTWDLTNNLKVAGNIEAVGGNVTGKFAVKSTSVHGSYDFYNNGTSYLNGALTVDAAFTQSGGAGSTFSGTVSTGGDLTVGGTTGSTGNALAVNRGSDGAQALRVQNSGEVVVPSNYFYAAATGVSMYVQNTAVFRGSIVNDGGDVTIGDTLSVTGDATFAGNVKVKNTLIDNTSVTSATTTTTVASVAKATYTAAFFDYSIKNGTNVRAGTVVATHDGTNVEYAETSTVDLGDTSDVTLTVDISGADMRLRATTTSSTWTIKSLIRAI